MCHADAIHHTETSSIKLNSKRITLGYLVTGNAIHPPKCIADPFRYSHFLLTNADHICVQYVQAVLSSQALPRVGMSPSNCFQRSLQMQVACSLLIIQAKTTMEEGYVADFLSVVLRFN